MYLEAIIFFVVIKYVVFFGLRSAAFEGYQCALAFIIKYFFYCALICAASLKRGSSVHMLFLLLNASWHALRTY